jgi:hypothetical protein
MDDIKKFIFGGNATFTLRSKKTMNRFTFKMQRPEDHEIWSEFRFVKVLTGPDNESNYAYLGTWGKYGYKYGHKSKISSDAPSSIAMMWFARCVDAQYLPDTLEVWHEGRCAACNHKLTVPKSLKRGFGPDCAKRLGVVCEELTPEEEMEFRRRREEWGDA